MDFYNNSKPNKMKNTADSNAITQQQMNRQDGKRKRTTIKATHWCVQTIRYSVVTDADQMVAGCSVAPAILEHMEAACNAVLAD